MLKILSLKSINNQHNKQRSNLKNNFCSHRFENNQELNVQIFEKSAKIDMEYLKNNKINKLNIFQTSFMTRYMFICSRYQIMAYCFASVFYCQYNLYHKITKINKRQDDLKIIQQNQSNSIEQQQKINKRIDNLNARKQKLGAFNFCLLSISVLATAATYKMGKVILRSIDYIPQTKHLNINCYSLFCFKKPKTINIQDLKLVDKTIAHSNFSIKSCYQYYYLNEKLQEQYLVTKGTGSWIQKDIVETLKQIEDE